MAPHLRSIREYVLHLHSFGANVALVNSTTGATTTYAALAERILNLSASLHSLVGHGDRVILKNLPHDEWIPIFFALLLNGSIAVPVDHRMSEDFFMEIIGYVDPKYIVSHGTQKATHDVPILKMGDILISSSASSDGESLQGIAELGTPAEIIFTSGTWSKPKGAVLSHGNLLANLDGLLGDVTPNPSDTFLSVLPLAHAYEQMCGMFLPLYAGSRIVSMGDITSKSLLDAMDTYGVTKIIAVPRILELFKTSMLRKIKNQNLRRAFTAFVLAAKILPPSVRRKLFTPVHRAMGRHLKTLVVGGAALPQKLDSFFQGLGYEVFVGYGLSEASPVLTISLEQKRTQGDIGKALRNVSLHVNEAGEIVAEGPNVFLGYWPNVHRHGEFNTQDLGNIDARGHVHIVGRTKNLLVYPSGDKIFLEDVEQIADAIPGVEESCAINTGANMGSPEIHVLIISKRTDAVAMKAAIQGKLPYFAKVQKVTIVPNGQLPRTHTLKLNRREIIEKLPELEGSGS